MFPTLQHVVSWGACYYGALIRKELNDNEISLRALVGKVDGTQILRSEHVDSMDSAEELGVRVADDLLSKGARGILDELRIEWI